MADRIEGEVLSIKSSDTTKGKFWRIEVKDDDGADWFGCGNEQPDFGEGSVVAFDFTTTDDGKFYNVDGDIEVLDLVEPKGRGGRGGSGNSRSSGRGSNSGSSRGSSHGSSHESGRSGSGRGTGSGRGASKSTKSSGSGAKKETDWEAKDKRTALGFAREQAIKVLNAMLEKEVVKLPTKQAEKYDAYLSYVDELAARFLDQADRYVDGGIEAIGGDYGDGED